MRTAANNFYIASQIHDLTSENVGEYEVLNAATNERAEGTQTYVEARDANAKAEELNGKSYMARAAAANDAATSKVRA